MLTVLDDYLLPFLKAAPIQELSQLEGITFKKQIDWLHRKETEPLYFVNWGENLWGTHHGSIETGFFYNAAHIDNHGLYQYSSLNLPELSYHLNTLEVPTRAQTFLKQGLLCSKFLQDPSKLIWTGIILMCQHPTDRSILRVGTTKHYWEFLEAACLHYGNRLYLKLHPTNTFELEGHIQNLAQKYGCSVGRTGINVIDHCEWVLVYNSTGAIDALLRDKPVVQYAPGYFWKTGAVHYSEQQFIDPIGDNEYNQRFCDFLLWKYCFPMHHTADQWKQLLNVFGHSKKSFPLLKEHSYGQFLTNTNK